MLKGILAVAYKILKINEFGIVYFWNLADRFDYTEEKNAYLNFPACYKLETIKKILTLQNTKSWFSQLNNDV